MEHAITYRDDINVMVKKGRFKKPPIYKQYQKNRLKINVLHVEDDVYDAKIVKEMLIHSETLEDITLTHMSTLEAALSAMRTDDSFDAILLDLNLGDGHGADNIRTIQNQSPGLPVIVLTGTNHVDLQPLNIASYNTHALFNKDNIEGNVLAQSLKACVIKKNTRNIKQKMSGHDSVTGLPTKWLFEQELEKALIDVNLLQNSMAMLMINLNNNSELIEDFGIEAINDINIELAIRLQNFMKANDVVASFGEGRFALMTRCLSQTPSDFLKALALNINVDLNRPFYLQRVDQYINFSVSIGGTVSISGTDSYKKLMHTSERAIYRTQSLINGRKVHIV